MDVCVVTNALSARGDHCTIASSALNSDLDANDGPDGTLTLLSLSLSSSPDTVDDSRPIRSG